MARSNHANKNIDIENTASQTVRFEEQQLSKNDTNNHEINNTPKSTKKQKHKSSFRRKSLREHITSQLEDPDFVHPYTDLKEYPFSRVITSKETLGKEWEKNREVVWD